jgi:hypothetical protein
MFHGGRLWRYGPKSSTTCWPSADQYPAYVVNVRASPESESVREKDVDGERLEQV